MVDSKGGGGSFRRVVDWEEACWVRTAATEKDIPQSFDSSNRNVFGLRRFFSCS